MLAVKKLMPESLLNYRFRGTTMSHSELIVALENIIVDKAAMVPTARGTKHDTSAPMEIGMAAKEDGENASQEGDQRIIDLALQAVYKGTGKGKWGFSKGQNWNEKGGKGGKDGGKNSWQKGSGKKGGKGQEVMDGVKSSEEDKVRKVVMGGVKTGEVGKLENCKIDEEMWCQSEEKLCDHKKALRDATVKYTRCWQMWKKNKNKTSYVLTTSPARNSRGMQCAKLVN